MATATHYPKMRIEEFLALPEDGVDRELIAGEVRERGPAIHGFRHAACLANLCCLMGNWLRADPSDGFEGLAGQPGFILHHNPPTVVGPDFAVVDRDVPTDNRTGLVAGVPRLAIEILSPSDDPGDMGEKIRLYLDHGVAAVWIVDPDDRTVRIDRRGHPLLFFNAEQTLTCVPEMPGFAVRVCDLFC